MHAYSMVVVLWIGITVVWVAGAMSAKQTVRRQSRESRRMQLLLTVAAYFLLFSPLLNIGILGWHVLPNTRTVHGVGLGIAVAG
ncbi:MAG TPA: hypothetical protein VMF56_14295, partial [Acidobacteriaceae bacterium]|nr:hypothetical protein [Acidobacteriaceae bacterium]